jgi:hypothetical protein
MERMYLEITRYCEENLQAGRTDIPWNKIPPELRRMWDVDGEIHTVRVVGDVSQR